MTDPLPLGVTHSLILVRLLPAARSPGPKRVRDDLSRLFQHRYAAAQWNTVFGEALGQLEQWGLLTSKPLRLTVEGQQQALQFLGLDSLPPGLNWGTIKKVYLPMLALGIPVASQQARTRLKGVDALRGEILRRHYELPIDACPSLRQAVEALAWQQIDPGSQRKAFNKDEVIAFLLGRLIGLERGMKLDQLRNQVVARAVGARNNSADELYDATVRTLIDRLATRAPTAPDPVTSGQDTQEAVAQPGARRQPFDLDGFARQIARAARQAEPSAHFGENKVFISRIWQQLHAQPPFREMQIDDFKARLAEANHRGLLELSQADLVEAMPPGEVAESETRYHNAIYHFVRI